MNELAKSISELINTINSGANGLGSAMQTHAPELWRLAVRQVILDAASNIALFLSLSTIAFLVGMRFGKAAKSWSKKEDDAIASNDHHAARNASSESAGYTVAQWIIVTIAVIMAGTALSCNIPKLLNPGYEAASQLSSRFLGK